MLIMIMILCDSDHKIWIYQYLKMFNLWLTFFMILYLIFYSIFSWLLRYFKNLNTLYAIFEQFVLVIFNPIYLFSFAIICLASIIFMFSRIFLQFFKYFVIYIAIHHDFSRKFVSGMDCFSFNTISLEIMMMLKQCFSSTGIFWRVNTWL